MRPTSLPLLINTQHYSLLPDRNIPPMEEDTAYQGCIPSCELHSRSHSLSGLQAKFVDCTCDLGIEHTCYAISRLPAQSRDSENVQRNLEFVQILRLRRTHTCKCCLFIVGAILQGLQYLLRNERSHSTAMRISTQTMCHDHGALCLSNCEQ